MLSHIAYNDLRNSEQGSGIPCAVSSDIWPNYSSKQRLDPHSFKRKAIHMVVPDLVRERLKRSKGLQRKALAFALAEVRDMLTISYGTSKVHLSQAASQ